MIPIDLHSHKEENSGPDNVIIDGSHVIPEVHTTATREKEDLAGITLSDNHFGPSILHHIS